MNYRRKYHKPLSRYTFKAEDDWGDYDNGVYREGHKSKGGYIMHWYVCEDGKGYNITEHSKKWEYFNGKIPEGYEIDHIVPIKNGGTNKLSNLRLVTPKENANNPLTKKNVSKGLKGKYTGQKNHMFGKRHSEETKKKMSNNNAKYWLGKKHSEETKKKISEKLTVKGHKLTEETKNKIAKSNSKKVYQYTSDGKLIKEWDSTMDCHRNGFQSSGVSQCCNGKMKEYKGYKWSYVPL